MSKENTVVSGRYFAGMWKWYLYPLFLLLGWEYIEVILYSVLGMALFTGFTSVLIEGEWVIRFFSRIAIPFLIYSDVSNLRRAHSVKKHGLIFYIMAFLFPGVGIIIYYMTRRSVLLKNGLTEERLTLKDRILPYDKNKHLNPS